MKIILFLILLAIVFATFAFLGWLYCNWIDGYKDAGVRMSFGEFRRIYELAPSEWKRYGDYTYRREEWIPLDESRGKFCGTSIATSIAMKTLFDFWRLLLWLKRRARRYKREMRFKTEKACLKNLSIMIEKDAENIRKEIEKRSKKPKSFGRRLLID